MNNSCDAVVVALKELYDQYGVCGARLFELQKRLQGGAND